MQIQNLFKKTILALIAMLVIGSVGYSVVISSPSEVQAKESESKTTAELAATEALDTPEGNLLPTMILGDPDAPVTVVEYASFTCPHCARFHQNTMPAIKAAYIATGKVKFIFREYPFDRPAFLASIAARCVPEDRYFDAVSVLFENQRTWPLMENPLAYFLQMAASLGTDADSFKECMQDEGIQQGIVASRWYGQNKDNVRSTPTFIIGDVTLTGARPFEEFKPYLEDELAKLGVGEEAETETSDSVEEAAPKSEMPESEMAE